MASTEGRRSFLLSITLTELSFIMFFLLMIISAATLQNTKQQLKQEAQKKTSLQAELSEAKEEHEKTFKRLQLIESGLMRSGGFSARPSSEQLDELFSRLQEIKPEGNIVQLSQENASLQRELESLQEYKRIVEVLDKNGMAKGNVQQTAEQVFKQLDNYQKEQQLFKGRIAYMQNKLRGNGLDHPPCWADSQTGAVEYLFAMTLFEHRISIEAAWPEHRKSDSTRVPGVLQLVGKSLTQEQFKRQVQPIFAWSKEHECRHFVRITDDKKTSKAAFKRQMLAIEAYFYKYLQR